MRLPKNDRVAMMALIEQWQHSGMKQKDFYQQHNIPAHVFYYWHKCYRKKQKKEIKELPLTKNFVQLHPSSSRGSMGNIEIQLPNGVRIFLNEPVSVDHLKALTS